LSLSGGSLTILGTGIGPGAGLDLNAGTVCGGELDGPDSSITIGDGHNASLTLCGTGVVTCGAAYIGLSNNCTGTLLQTGGTLVVYTNMIIGDFCEDGAQGALGYATIDGGSVYVTNAGHTAVLEIRNGTFTLASNATLVVDNLVATNPCGLFMNNGGHWTATQSPLLTPHIMPAFANGSLALGFQTIPNTLYVLEQKTDLAMPWQTNAMILGDGSFTKVPVQTAGPARFFRIQKP
jgi:hypothetical protein